MNRYMFPIGLFVLAAALLLPSWAGGSGPTTFQVDTSGKDIPKEGALHLNGWNIENWGAARVLDFYLRYQHLLGEPVKGWDGTRMCFRGGCAIYTPGNDEQWKLELQNLGSEDMEVEGYTPRPRSSLHPAVREWIQSQREAGLDTVRIVGPVLSEPICDPRTARCKQWTAKQLFIISGNEVRRAPLGLWMTYPSAREMQRSESNPVVDVRALMAVPLVFIALTLLFRRPGSGSAPRATLG